MCNRALCIIKHALETLSAGFEVRNLNWRIERKIEH